MLYSLSILSDEGQDTKPLSTIGDAINSFLTREDHTTVHLGLMDNRSLLKRKTDWPVERALMTWEPTHMRWYRLVSTKRKIYTFLL
jgi:hypothetical protein